jgi:hypothetical protein
MERRRFAESLRGSMRLRSNAGNLSAGLMGLGAMPRSRRSASRWVRCTARFAAAGGGKSPPLAAAAHRGRYVAWLHPMSELIVDLDSLLAQERSGRSSLWAAWCR